MAKLYVRKSDGTYVPQQSVLVSNLDIVQEKGDSLISAMSQKAVTDELATKQDTISDLETIRSNAQNASDAVTSMIEAGYVFAGVATPSTNPETPNAKVFYLANGKGTYTNFGGIEVIEDEVVVLYYDTAWHKEVTGIASQAKLTDLKDKVELQEVSIRTINKKIDGVKIVSSTITATSNVNLNKSVSFEVPAGDWTILTHSDFGEGHLGTITFRDAENTTILSKDIIFGAPLVITLQSAAVKALIYMSANNVKDGGSLYLTAEQSGITDDLEELSQGITDIKQDLADEHKALSIITSDNLFVPSVNTQTGEGVTCALSDGHYILSGTATAYKYFWFNTSSKISVKQGEKYALLGTNVNSASYSFAYKLYKNGKQIKADKIIGNSVLTIGDADQLELGINVHKGVTYNNDIVDIIAVSAYSAVYPLYMQTIAEIKKKPRPLLTIIDDDGNKKFHTLLLPLIISKKVPISTAIVGANISVEDYAMTWDELKECAEAGAEILSHTYSHLSAEAATEMAQHEIQTDYQKMQNIMRLHGYDGSILVFAGDSSNRAKCVNACKYVYSCGIKAGTNKTNYIDTINRYGIDRWNVIPSTTDMQALLDTLASTGTGWMVWMIHTSDANFQSDSVTALGNAIDYARALGIDIVNVAAGVAYYLDGRD